VSDVNRLLKNFLQMQKMMKSMTKGGGMARMMRAMSGKLPPGLGG
jgi:signal recognition particle subunit SRP54